MIWSFYDAETGLFSGRTLSGSAKLLPLNTPVGCAALEGRYDRRTQRVDVATGAVVAYERPAAEIEAEERAASAASARSAIDALERAQRRPVRELLIDPTNVAAKQRLAEIDAAIAALRGQLQVVTTVPASPVVV